MLAEATLLRAAETLARLRARGVRLVTAESCTGGLIAAALTHHAGSSDCVEGGFVTYSNALKERSLGVCALILQQFGAVSEETARAMAQGALNATPDADLAIAVTGIAGPGGGSVQKPVGLVCFGLAERGQTVRSEHRVFPGDRASVREATVLHALDLVLGALGN